MRMEPEEQDDLFGDGFFGILQRKLWNVLENPHSSHGAKVNEWVWPDLQITLDKITKSKVTRFENNTNSGHKNLVKRQI